MTWSEIESSIYRVFPAAEIYVANDEEASRARDVHELQPGDWIDDLEHSLEGEDLFEDRLEYLSMGAVDIIAFLNVVMGTDTRGESAFVPVDYASRYGPAPEWPGADEPDGLGDAYDNPPIDAVPPDDRTNISWAEESIWTHFPYAEFNTRPGGQGLMLNVAVFLKASSPTGEDLFETAIDPFGVLAELSVEDHGSVWEREEERNARRRRIKEQLDQIPTELPLDAQLRLISSFLARAEAEPWMSDAIHDAQLLARLPARKPLSDALREGESSTVEFKITARSQYRTGERSRDAEAEVARTVAAFMNSMTGGVLLIGVSDQGEVVGLESDLVRMKGNLDKLQLSVVQNLEASLGLSNVALCVTMTVEQVSNHLVIVIRALPSQSPVYARQGNDEEFLIRSGPSTKQLPLSQIRRYVDQRWGRGTSEL